MLKDLLQKHLDLVLFLHSFVIVLVSVAIHAFHRHFVGRAFGRVYGMGGGDGRFGADTSERYVRHQNSGVFFGNIAVVVEVKHLESHEHFFFQRAKINVCQPLHERILEYRTVIPFLIKSGMKSIVNYSRQLCIFEKCYVVYILLIHVLILFRCMASQSYICEYIPEVRLHF